MKPVLVGVSGLVCVLAVGLGGMGSWLHAVPVTGLVLGPVLLLIVIQHGVDGLLLMWGGLTGRLPIGSWMAAREVAASAERDVLIVGLIGSALGVLQLGGVPVEAQLAAAAHAMLPLLLAVGLHLTLFSPLLKRLTEGHALWAAALREALSPPPVSLPTPAPLSAPARRGVA